MILNKRIPFSYIFKQVFWDILLVIFFSLLIDSFNRYVINFSVPIQIPSFLGTAIALVLAFKLNQSYDRWWEGRKIWGAIVNDSRSLALQLTHFSNQSDKSNDGDLLKRVIQRHIAWCYALGRHLRRTPILTGLESYFDKNEISELHESKNVPLAILDFNLSDISTLKKNGMINDFQHIQIDNSFVRLCSSMGQAERIKNTVFPKTYRLYLHFFIYVFLFTLAMSISDLHTALEVPLMIVISLPFFLLEKTSFHMQDPFENRPTDTPMTAIATTIDNNLSKIMGVTTADKSVDNNDFYQM